MTAKHWILLGVLVISVSVASSAYFGQERFEPNARNRSLQHYAELRQRAQQATELRQSTGEVTPPATTPTTIPDCHFTMPDISLDGGRVLLDECTGNVWRFDSGYDWKKETYVRPYSFQPIPRH